MSITTPEYTPSFAETLRFWLKLGFISFGGPAGQIAIMHEYVVEKKKWISESRFLNALNYCMLLPGPEAQQLATYLGWLLHGTRGGLAAGILFILPSVFILLGLSLLYVTFGQLAWVNALFEGLKPAVIAIIILAFYKIGKRTLFTRLNYLIAIFGFVSIFFLKIPFPLIILSVIVLGLVVSKYFPKLAHEGPAHGAKSKGDESGYAINIHTPAKNTGFNRKRILVQIGAAVLFFGLPLSLIYGLLPDFGFWSTLVWFFTKAAFVTFGGAYAVLPYVAQVSVEKYQWLSNLQMMDGLALGETTPGPLIMVLAFVGFMAGYNYFESSLLFGSAALLITTYFTFLPCFLFIFIGAPIIEATRQNSRLKVVLNMVTSAVVGVILNLSIYLGESVLFTQKGNWSSFDFISAIWAAISIFFLLKTKMNMIAWIVISALFGLGRYLLGF